MKKNEKRNLLILIILLLITGVTIGFAAYQRTLTISSSATVTPDASIFRIQLSADGENISAQDTIPAEPRADGNAVTGTDAIIKNGGNPTVSGIEVNFSEPGAYMEYMFYVHNTGEYDAYLNEIKYNNVEGENSNIVCKAVETGDETRATDALVEAACDGINIGFNYYVDIMGEVDIYSIDGNMSFTNEKLPIGGLDAVNMVVSYNKNSVIADGPFTVEIGDIEFVYSTVDVNATTE